MAVPINASFRGSPAPRAGCAPHWETPFLKALERCGVASEAARLAGTGVRNAFKRRKGNSTFAAAWDAAVALHRAELGRRAMAALAEEGVAYQSGPDGAKVLAAGQSRWSKRSEEAFLVELTTSGSVRVAAKAAGFSTAALYKRRLKDRHFLAAWDAALETGKARVQSYLVEAATRTFDPDELPIADEHEIPKVSIGEAINIAKMPARPSTSPGTGPSTSLRTGPSNTLGMRGIEGRTYDETGFDTTPITREEWEEAKQRIIDRLERIRERDAEAERETGCCRTCGQALPIDA